MDEPLLRVRDLRVSFPGQQGGILRRAVDRVKVVDGVGFEVARGQTLGLVGESGCGKTTVGRAVLRLLPASAVEGTVAFEGEDVLRAPGAVIGRLRRRMQIVFQDPGGSLNPRMRVAEVVGEPLIVHERKLTGREVRRRAAEMLERCGMPASAMERYPHEFSGGQKQRIAIARALMLHPTLLVCDEPTSALDVSVQAQVLNLLTDLQREMGLSYLFISHDMAVVNQMCDRVAVMLAGTIVEEGEREKIMNAPEHPYTRKLLAAVPEVVVR
ncbi:MAG TPA: ATP-binding cassette domain-containing protein [Phycisphaerales bacterium]|nr:ATP-binding cassette domain-containing protein [Phycisphaerales bacterium]